MEKTFEVVLFIALLTLSACTPSTFAFRVRKASRKSLDRIKRLINEQTERDAQKYALDGALDDGIVLERKDPASRAHHDELSVNDPDEYFQGDVDLSERQAELLNEVLEDAISDNNSQLAKTKDVAHLKTRHKRKVGREPLYVRWSSTNAISYDFADSIPFATRQKIRAAIALWEKRTCLRFQENGPNVDRIEFFDGGGCSSFVGKTGGTQGISIATPGCDVVGIISHEIGHALGIFHEQARPDQNGHIFVNYNNIPISRWNNFHPVPANQADTYNLPYDTGSVMHYGAYGFATDPYVPTITTRDKFQQFTIGQREGPSFLDFAAINIAYHCVERCPYMHCEHDGYVNPNDCNECLCPDGFAGRNCQFVHFTPCGALITASEEPIYITTPNYPQQFAPDTQCIWLLKAAKGHKVVVQFVGLFEMFCEDTCDKTYVEIKNSGDFRITGYRFCCPKKQPSEVFESVTNEMVIIFRSHLYTARGFKAKIWSNLADTSLVKPIQPPIAAKVIPTKRPAPPKPPVVSVVLPTLATTPTTSVLSTTTTTIPSPKVTTSTEPSIRLLSTKASAATGGVTSTPRSGGIVTAIATTTTKAAATIATTLPSIIPTEAGIKSVECECGEWSEWTGQCSQECGGCGKRTRYRTCKNSDECRKEDKRACNYVVCPPGTNFLINNGEFHILWKGCCVGLFRSGNECSTLDDSENPFLQILSSLLINSPQDPRRYSNSEVNDDEGAKHDE